jgi:hypothetical protein
MVAANDGQAPDGENVWLVLCDCGACRRAKASSIPKRDIKLACLCIIVPLELEILHGIPSHPHADLRSESGAGAKSSTRVCPWPSASRGADLQALIRIIACDNPTWSEERVATELALKLGLRVSLRTMRKYLPKRLDHGGHRRVPSQRWLAFVRNHAQTIISCAFGVVVTATFRLLYVFVVIEHATRRMLHGNVAAHPTAA